ncbi:mycothiol conjugate amidase Mca [Paeniglutamicibacter cryotolerans]|uniref:Mycothiol S-conjugate amidase n=2 Tax=Paeniglutamicibacter cryotolerans TaxID=670079 RepID=A0A839QPL3_9MICC|nr:mycothiol S-conjugate amidase [Paeniglutamicibacter cryotolerans]
MEEPRIVPIPPSSGMRLLAVHAHPDDESSKGAAMMAAYSAAGAQVIVATCTGGELGDILNAAVGELAHAHRDLAGVRRGEMAEAADILGVEHRWLGFVDSGLPEGDPLPALDPLCFALQPLESATAPLVKLIREFRPQVLISYDENGGYPHPDHIMSHKITVEAYKAAADPARYPELGEPWSVSKLYYDRAFNPERFRTLHYGMVESGIESPYAERVAEWEAKPDAEFFGWVSPHETTTQVACFEYFEHRDRALLAHRTQIDPTGFFFAVPSDVYARYWPWEDYSLIDSKVPTSLPEDDLFAGLR